MIKPFLSSQFRFFPLTSYFLPLTSLDSITTPSPNPHSPINILFLIDKLAPAGTQTNLLEIVRRLDRTRFVPHVISLSEGGGLENEFNLAGTAPVIWDVKRVYDLSAMRALIQLYRYVIKNRIDIIQTFFLKAEVLGGLAARFAGVKTVIASRRDEGFWVTGGEKIIRDTAAGFPSLLLANSEAVKKAVLRDEKTRRPVRVIYNGIDASKFDVSEAERQKIRAELGVHGDEVVIGVVANMRHEIKGYADLIEAVPLITRKCPRARFWFVGEGRLRTGYQNKVRSLGLNHTVQFLGSRRDINAILNGMDIFCLPSHTEGFSNAILEAMAAGKPVVATQVGGNPEIVKDDITGFLVAPRVPTSLAENILRLTHDAHLRQVMGDQGRQRVLAEFTVERMVARYEELYGELMREKDHRPETIDHRPKAGSGERGRGNGEGEKDQRPETIDQRPKAGNGERETGKEKICDGVPACRSDGVNKEEESGERQEVREKQIPIPQTPTPTPQSPAKVLYIIWSLDLGGAEQVVMNLAREIDRSCFEPMVCCLNEKGRFADDLEKSGIKVVALRKLPKFDPFLVPKLVSLIKKEKIDLIHTHLFTANLWGRLAARWTGTPVVCTEHNVDEWKGGFELAVDRMLAARTNRMIFVSLKVEEFYRERMPSMSGRTAVLYNGIDVRRYSETGDGAKIRAQFGIGQDAEVLGIAGRLVPQKGHECFIEALRLLKEVRPNLKALVAGDGPLRKSLEEKVRIRGLSKNVIFAGMIRDMASFYKAVDIFVLSSLREGFPMTILEAMAAGTPVISTNVGGVGECIESGKDGLLIPSQDSRSLADSVLRLLANRQERDAIVRAAREKVSRLFSIEKMAADHEAMYDEVMRRPETGDDRP